MTKAANNRQTTEIPGLSIQMHQRIRTQVGGEPPATLGSSVMLFETARHFLSEKPLRRPNRTRPIDS